MPRPGSELQDLDKAIGRLTFGAARLEPVTAAEPPRPLTFERILVAVDGSERSRWAVDWAARIGAVFGSRLWVVHVVQPPDLTEHYLDALGALAVEPPEDLGAALERDGRAVVDAAAARLRESRLKVKERLAHGRPTRVLVDTAAEVGADLVVLGSHGRGPVGRLVLGSVADGLKSQVRASVLIAKTPGPGSHLLLATDGSRASRRAVALGLRLGRSWDLPATVLHVLDAPSFPSGPDPSARRAEVFRQATSGWPDPRVRFELEFGDPADRVSARARDAGVGLVVMGSRGLGGLGNLWAGSVSGRVAHEAPVSVLLVKEGP